MYFSPYRRSGKMENPKTRDRILLTIKVAQRTYSYL